jgi:Tfp pilus assembly protein FimT
MFSARRLDRGYSLTELLMIMAVAGTLMAFALPILTDLGEGTKLAAAGREIERELQSARLKAVTVNRVMRVRLNCPATGYFRTVEVLGNATDQNTNRCVQSAFPFPAPDQDLITRPNFDGPVRLVSSGATVTSQVLEFRPDGTAALVVSNVAQDIVTPVTITVTRKGKSKTVTVNGAGKVLLAQ